MRTSGRKRLVSATDHAAKIRAAAENRANSDTVIIARIDAIAGNGLDDAMARGDLLLSCHISGGECFSCSIPDEEDAPDSTNKWDHPTQVARNAAFNDVFNGLLGWDQALAFINHYTKSE